MKKIVNSILLVGVAAALVACSATPVRRSLKESWNDTMTAQKIRYKLMKDKEVHKGRMHVEVFRGQVTLTGRAAADTERARAELLAKSVKRVTGVENYVHVVGGGKAAPATVAAASVAPTAVATVVPSAKPTAASGSGIQEKVIVTEKVKVVEKVSEDDLPATISSVPTVRVGTGTGQSVTAVKVAGKTAKPTAKDSKLATVKKAPAQQAPVAKVAPSTPVKSVPVAKSAAQASVVKEAETAMSTPASSTVVGKSKTGLPWDGEVYEDDASSMKSAATAARHPEKPVTAATPAKVAPTPAPTQAAPPVPTGDDLAKEAAQELEKLRSKK